MAGTAPTPARALRVPARGRLPAQGLLPAAVAALVAYLTLLPLIFLLYGTFFTPTIGGVAGTFTLQNYLRAYTDRSAPGILLDSLTLAVGAALVAFTIGATPAWITGRTDTPLRGLLVCTSLSP